VVRGVIGHVQNGRYRVDYAYPVLAGAAGPRPVTFSGGEVISPPTGHPGQVYFLTVSLTYTKQADGFWRDHRRHERHASHDHFEFGRA
jgi:hypothetical protein